eukprot:TRINITY_DN5972_c0_g1_i2.p2 TRINITY_DN5972_c0_g1~~TRINITY_DN5972_c0_g1_i2.p2  ORF type:complete len:121 (-),score=19.78 TRINITY_DN5972_c0_g1_i2:8-349(-)
MADYVKRAVTDIDMEAKRRHPRREYDAKWSCSRASGSELRRLLISLQTRVARAVSNEKHMDNYPHETFSGKEQQLETAVEHILQQLKAKPIVKPVAPAYPNKVVDGCYEGRER